VDHGKSTLVRALTGIDPDRLEEEKRRGLTIDLGFAWLTVRSGQQVGIVDVPGHERFIKNMLAGAGSVDLALFVVAANEGWKPQSQEHLDIMSLLQVTAAIVVITKADTVGAEEIALVREEIADHLAPTTLAGSPILEVSATTGKGLDELIAEIEGFIGRAPRADGSGRARLWIDRAFSIKGSGTVVTGTLGQGTLSNGQEIEILPGAGRARIRAIQSHQTRVEELGPGNRTALNLVGVELEALHRGDAVVGPGAWRPTEQIVASVRLLPHLDHQPKLRSNYKLHLGSVELDAAVRFLGAVPQPGQSGFALIRLAHPTVVDWHDKFILRDSGRKQTIGGGVVLEAHAQELPKREEALLPASTARLQAAHRADYLAVLLEEQGYLKLDEIPVKTGLGVEGLAPSALKLGSLAVSAAYFDLTTERIKGLLESYQQANPMQPGLPLTALRAQLGLPAPVLEELVAELASRDLVVADATVVRTAGFAPKVMGPEALKLIDELNSKGNSPPPADELLSRHGAELVRALVRSGELVRVSPGLIFSAEGIRQIKRQIAERIGSAGPFTVAEFRDMVSTTRKYAVPLLEYLDQIGFTSRRGDLRALGPKPSL
jgi:selenocysteine-specific elongation factor